jgi:hypothetical protein
VLLGHKVPLVRWVKPGNCNCSGNSSTTGGNNGGPVIYTTNGLSVNISNEVVFIGINSTSSPLLGGLTVTNAITAGSLTAATVTATGSVSASLVSTTSLVVDSLTAGTAMLIGQDASQTVVSMPLTTANGLHNTVTSGSVAIGIDATAVITVAGVLFTPGTSGSTPTSLTNIEKYSGVMSSGSLPFNGITNFNVQIQCTNTKCDFEIAQKATTVCSAAAIATLGGMPTRFFPVSAQSFPIIVTNSGANTFGTLSVTTGGVVTIYPGSDPATLFGATGNCGLYNNGVHVSWFTS